MSGSRVPRRYARQRRACRITLGVGAIVWAVLALALAQPGFGVVAVVWMLLLALVRMVDRLVDGGAR